jgi:glycine cleavage system regulatory protein
MNHSLVMTILATDRKGLVRAIASIVNEHKGNWQESSMARLSGQFAGILRVDCPATEIEGLKAALNALDSQGIHIKFSEEPLSTYAERRLITIDVVGNDRPGIVHQLTNAIADAGGNVEELVTSLESAAMSGQALFRASGKISLLVDGDEQKLLSAIENLSDDLSVEIY